MVVFGNRLTHWPFGTYNHEVDEILLGTEGYVRPDIVEEVLVFVSVRKARQLRLNVGAHLRPALQWESILHRAIVFVATAIVGRSVATLRLALPPR